MTPHKKHAGKKGHKNTVHVSSWWKLMTYLFGVLFFGLVGTGMYAYTNPQVLKNIDALFKASVVQDNAEKFCHDMLFADALKDGGMFEIDEFVCRQGVIVPVEILYDGTCPECLPANIENTLKIILPTSVITKTDVATLKNTEILINTLPYIIIDEKVEKTEAFELIAGKAPKVGTRYYLNPSVIVNSPRTTLLVPKTDNIPAKGVKEAPVTIIEFVGTTCPACGTFISEVWPELKKDYIDKGIVQYYSKLIPVGEDEELAKAATDAALCAFDQGKYFEYLGKMLSAEPDWGTEALEKMASELKLGAKEFEICLKEKRLRNIAEESMSDLQALGINSIPSYIIGNKVITGPVNMATLKSLIEGELQKHMAASPEAKDQNVEPVMGEGQLEIRVYSDYACSSCAEEWFSLKEAVLEKLDAVKVTFIHTPNPENASGEVAANAAECAAAQGRFWEYMQLLFGSQNDLRASVLERLGVEAGFGGDFSACVRGSLMLPEVRNDMELAKNHGVEKAPAYFIDGQRIEPKTTKDGWLSEINKKL